MAKKNRKRLKHGTRDLAKPKSSVSVSRPTWDQGAMGPANRVGLASEPVTWTDDDGNEVNPNDVKRFRRWDMLEVYHRRGWISDRGWAAGKAIRNAWAGTMRSRGMDWSSERVDSSPKPDAHIAIQIDRVSKLVRVSSLIPHGDLRIVYHVACYEGAIGRLREYRGSQHDKGRDHLRAALDRLADALRM